MAWPSGPIFPPAYLLSFVTDDVADGEPVKYSALNRELHRMVLEISGQAVAAGLLARLNGQFVRHQFQLSLRPGRPQQSLPEHLAIIDAIASRDPAKAEEVARRHLRSVVRALHETTGRDTEEPFQ